MVLFVGDHVGKILAIAHEGSKLSDILRRKKTGPDHSAHEKIANPLGVFTICLVALHSFGVLWISKDNVSSFFKDG